MVPGRPKRPRYRPGQTWDYPPQWWAGDQPVVTAAGGENRLAQEVAHMAHGDVVPRASPAAQPAWSTGIRRVGPSGSVDHPLATTQLELLDDVMREAERSPAFASRSTSAIGQHTAASAESLLDSLGADAPYAVLLAVSPGQRVVEVVTGPEAARRVSDRPRGWPCSVWSPRAPTANVGGALVTGVRILADQAGTLPERSTW